MAILGAHISIAGGFDAAVRQAARLGCDCIQIFSKNNNQWRGRPITAEQASRFQEALAETGVGWPLVHASYLINLASPDPALWKKSVDAMIDELHRAEQLGVPHVVVHPGSFTTADEATGIEQIVRALDEIARRTDALTARCLLETTAGQGTGLGHRFEQLAAVVDRLKKPERIDFCLDTCHIFAAGYPLAERRDYLKTMRELDRRLGLDRIRAIHLNDSKKELGSRVDRHEHIGRGCLGLEPFAHLLNDRRLRKVPMYLETPKGTTDGVDNDIRNLEILRNLCKTKA